MFLIRNFNYLVAFLIWSLYYLVSSVGSIATVIGRDHKNISCSFLLRFLELFIVYIII